MEKCMWRLEHANGREWTQDELNALASWFVGCFGGLGLEYGCYCECDRVLVDATGDPYLLIGGDWYRVRDSEYMGPTVDMVVVFYA